MPTVEPMPTHSPAFRTSPSKPTNRRLRASVEYPESDGKPMAETPIHWHATVDFAQPLMDRYADQPVLVLGTHFANPVGGKIVRDGDTYRFDV